jgi:outer membrane biosynthesis protein TonB
VNTSILAEELAHLSTNIEHVQRQHDALQSELRSVEKEIEAFSGDMQRFDALRDVCSALGKLGELNAGELFWDGVANTPSAAKHLERVKNRIALFDGDIKGILEKRTSLEGQIRQCLNELDILSEEVRDAYDREERREEEYVIEREFVEAPNRSMTMPWRKDSESERRFRRSLLIAFLFYLVFGTVVGLWKLPPLTRPVVAVVPERLVSMLRKEPPIPEPVPDRPKEEKKADKTRERASEKPKEEQPKPTPAETQVARKRAETTGVLAFKDSFKDLMDEAPATKLGTEAKLNNQTAAAGQARASRSLVAIPATSGVGGSGGISNSGVSRNIGSGNGNRIGGVGFTRVESTMAGLGEGTRPLSSGPGPARTDEEIQIVFDKYKASLYRMYNAELRKDPTLRGKILLRITIEPGGEVSACTMQSSDLASPELVTQVVERIKKFNFGPKENVPKTTILYPIDFLPGG